MTSNVTPHTVNSHESVVLQQPETGVGIWSYQLGDDFRTCCQEWFDLRGLTATGNMQCRNDVWLQSVHPIDRPRLKQLIEDLNSGRITQLNERYRVLDAVGHWQWVLTRAEPTSWSSTSLPSNFSGVDIFLSGLSDTKEPDSTTVPRQSNDDIVNANEQGMVDVIKTLSVALESAGQGVWQVDNRPGGLSVVNTIWRTMRGHPATGNYNLGSNKWYNDIHPEDIDVVLNRNDVRDEMNTNIIDYTYRHRHKDGSWRWIWVRGKITERDMQGRPLRSMGSDTDITSLKAAEHRSERLSSTLNLAMQAAGMGVWDRRTNTEGSYWDSRACTVFGIDSPGRFVPNAEFNNRVHPDDREALENELNIATRACRPIAAEYRINHPTLGVRHLKTHADYHKSPDEPSRYVGLVWDVTEAYHRETELATAKHLLDDVIEQMEQGLVLFRGEDRASARVALANNRFFSILELPRRFRSHDASLQSYIDYLSANGYFSKDATAVVDRLLHQRYPRENQAIVLTTPSGRTVRATARRMDSDGFIVTFSDITDIIRAEQEQKELSERLSHNHRMQSIGELTGGIAHDFNNLLAIIAGNAELLSMSIGDDNRHLQAVGDAAHRGAELSQSLLAFSSKQALKPARIRMCDLVENVCRMLDRTLGDDITVKTGMPDDPWTCTADPGQLENALINLAVNARDAMHNGGIVNIEVSNKTVDKPFTTVNSEVAAGEYIQVMVSDTGTGMEPAVLDKAINPFFTTKRVGEGSGLGLSMVFGFVKQSDGNLLIQSEVNKGTKVSIYLPRSTSGQSAIQPVKAVSRDWQKGEGQRILLVEDDPDVQHVLESGLTKLGYEVVAVDQAKDALAAIESYRNTIELVITDITLPGGVNGFELGKVVQTHYAHLPVIYMSGYAQNALLETHGTSKDIVLLQKPFSISDLAMKIVDELEPALS